MATIIKVIDGKAVTCRMTKLDEMNLYDAMSTARAVLRRRQALQAKADQDDEAQDRDAD